MALVKLHRENLATLTPDPVYWRFHASPLARRDAQNANRTVLSSAGSARSGGPTSGRRSSLRGEGSCGRT
jgi:hypothetical protein